MSIFSNWPGDPPDPTACMSKESEEIYVLLDDAGVDQEVIDKVINLTETLAGRLTVDCPECQKRGLEAEIRAQKYDDKGEPI